MNGPFLARVNTAMQWTNGVRSSSVKQTDDVYENAHHIGSVRHGAFPVKRCEGQQSRLIFGERLTV